MSDLSHPPAGDGPRVAPLRALVIVDEALIRWSVAETLASLDMEVAQAADAASAVDTISHAPAPFDIVVLDLRMPDVDDLSLLRRVRQLLPAAFVVLMTAFGTPEIMAEARALGASGVLDKPFELEDLSRLLLNRGQAPTA